MGANLNNFDAESPMSEINVTPFVDVMLVLLIIFMVTSPMLVSGIAVDLPETASQPLESEDDPLSVTVNRDGKIYLEEKEFSIEELIITLHAMSGENADLRLYVRGDSALDYGSVMQVIGSLNAAGFNKIGLITESSN